jgi:putative redox protein
MSGILEVTIEQTGASTSKATARTHAVLVDRPVARGGADQGPVGGEYMLIGLGGCFTSHLLGAIRAREANVSGVKVTVSGTLDGSPERFTELSVTVSAAGDPELIGKLTTIAERSCQVMNTLRGTVPITLQVEGAPAVPVR